MNIAFLGLVISLAYGVLSSAIIYLVEGKPQFQLFLSAYNTSSKP